MVQSDNVTEPYGRAPLAIRVTRVRSHCRFRNRVTEFVHASGRKWMAVVQCDNGWLDEIILYKEMIGGCTKNDSNGSKITVSTNPYM